MHFGNLYNEVLAAVALPVYYSSHLVRRTHGTNSIDYCPLSASEEPNLLALMAIAKPEVLRCSHQILL